MPTAGRVQSGIAAICTQKVAGRAPDFLGVLCGKDFDFAVTHAKILNRKGREGFRKGRKGNQEMRAAFLLIRFQYKYPGTPISTIAAPQKASVGRVTMVFSVHAPPMMT